MNKKPVWYKGLVVGVIVLFIGLGVQPAIAVIHNNIDNKDECNPFPEVIIQYIGSDISKICVILGVYFFSLIFKDLMFTNIAEDLDDSNPILSLISYSIATMYFVRVLFFGVIFSIFGCWDDWFDPYSISLDWGKI